MSSWGERYPQELTKVRKEKNYKVIVDSGEIIGTIKTAGEVTVSQGIYLREKKELYTTIGNSQIRLPVGFQGGSAKAMIDSGATGNFISRQAALDLRIPIRKKDQPYQLQVVSRDNVKEDNG
jgi:hypothetical protein